MAVWVGGLALSAGLVVFTWPGLRNFNFRTETNCFHGFLDDAISRHCSFSGNCLSHTKFTPFSDPSFSFPEPDFNGCYLSSILISSAPAKMGCAHLHISRFRSALRRVKVSAWMWSAWRRAFPPMRHPIWKRESCWTCCFLVLFLFLPLECCFLILTSLFHLGQFYILIFEFCFSKIMWVVFLEVIELNFCWGYEGNVFDDLFLWIS